MSISFNRDTRATAQFSQKYGYQPHSSIKINLPVQQRKGVDIDEFTRSINFELYAELDEEEQEEYLSDIDAIELFQKIKDLDDELAHVKLELYFFTDYLEQNNPRLLIGLKQRHSTIAASQKSARASRTSIAMVSSRRTFTGTDSMSFGLITGKKAPNEYRVNFKTKADMAEKSANEIEQRVKHLQKKGRKEIKEMRAEIAELRCRAEETDKTCENFVLNFMADEGDIVFLETANEKKIIDKLHRFISYWFKGARGLMATMRLRINHLHESIQEHRTELITKGDLSKVLNSVDFDQLKIKRTQLLNHVDEQFKNMHGVKNKTGKTAMAMGEEKASMVMLEEQHKQIIDSIAVKIKNISKIEEECKSIEANNKRDMKVVEELQSKLERYQAPSVASYIERKQELLALEKEEKILRRKISIMNMKLSNVNKQYKLKKNEEF